MWFDDISREDKDFVQRHCHIFHRLAGVDASVLGRMDVHELEGVLTMHRLVSYALEADADNLTQGYFFYENEREKRDYIAFHTGIVQDALDMKSSEFERALKRSGAQPKLGEDTQNVRSLFEHQSLGVEDTIWMEGELDLVLALSDINGRIRDTLGIKALDPEVSREVVNASPKVIDLAAYRR